MSQFTALDKALLDRYQKGFPLTSSPWATIAKELGSTEVDVFNAFQTLNEKGVISRIGPVFDHHKAGASTLAAMAIPEDRLDEIAYQVSQFEGVNHNYGREHRFNLWFVVTAKDECALDSMLAAIEAQCGYQVLKLPMVKGYHIDLGFPLSWDLEDKSDA